MKLSDPSPPFWKRLRRWQKVVVLALTAVLVGSAGLYVWLFTDLPSIDQLDAGLALPSTRIYDRNGRLLYEIIPASETGGRNSILPLDAMPLFCLQAVIATEDANFYQHPGVDFVGIVRAAWINLQGGEVIAGGSTITQQVARNLLLDPQQRAERSLRRKLREGVLALQLQNRYSKDEILALYLNQSYFGNLAYGLDAAARAYFTKPAADLSLAECALLAGILQAPAVYDPLTNLESAQARQGDVLDLMVQTGSITVVQAASAKLENLQFAASPFPIDAPHFVMAVIKQLEREYPDAFYGAGLEVVTTVDLDWQEAAEEIVNIQLDYLNSPRGVNSLPADAQNAALVAMDPFTGQVLAMLGSPNYFDESIDGAVNAAYAPRQPGSALKPFTYAAAFDPNLPEPFTPATMILDIKTPFVTRRLESYTPANFALVEHGPVLVREALASSFNIPAVVTLNQIGIASLINLANNAGLTTLANNANLDLAITLGGGEVRLIDLVGAYSVFPNGGFRVDPVLLLKVSDHSGNTLYEWQPPMLDRQVMDERVAFLITDILSDDSARIPGFGQHSALNIGRPAAAKTGTTTDFRDNWIVGYTPNLVVGVWVGNADNHPMQNITGVSGAAPIWNAFMRQVLLGQPEVDFPPPPEGVVQAEVCVLSGMLPSPDCPRTRLEWFIDGTQPTEIDTFYQRFAIDRRTGQLANETTPPEERADHVYVVLPQEARDWGIRNGLLPPPRGAALVAPDADAGLRLLAPDPYTVFQLSPVVPFENQRVRLRAGVPPGTERLTYYMDGEAVGTVESEPWSLWWPLAYGDHVVTAQAELADGTTLESGDLPFSVTSYADPVSRNAGE